MMGEPLTDAMELEVVTSAVEIVTVPDVAAPERVIVVDVAVPWNWTVTEPAVGVAGSE
jgi:hypothetical protein